MHKKSHEFLLGKLNYLIVLLIVLIISCNNDDDGNNLTPVEVRDRAEQQIADNNSIVKYLKTHYYNAEELAGISNPSMQDIVITALSEGETVPPEGYVILNDSITEKKVTFNEVEYIAYFLRVNKGGGKPVNFCDEVRVRYNGSLLDNTVFDAVATPVKFNLVGDGTQDNPGVITGWSIVLSEFNEAISFNDSPDGNVNYTNFGFGVMFIPSGLAYFNSPPLQSDITPYSPLIFKFEVLQAFFTDYDNDGVPSHLENLNGDDKFTVNSEDSTDVTDDDTDGDGLPDYIDIDDDGDGILTIDEDTNGDGDPTNDIGSNGIAKYLDPTE